MVVLSLNEMLLSFVKYLTIAQFRTHDTKMIRLKINCQKIEPELSDMENICDHCLFALLLIKSPTIAI